MSDRLQEVTRGEQRSGGLGGWFAGRSSRKGYWLWVGPVLLVGIVISAFLPPAAYAMSLMITLIWIRRFHDFGRSGWWVVPVNVGINIVSFAAMAVLPAEAAGLLALVLYLAAITAMGVIPGQAHENEFGPPSQRRAQPDLEDTFN